MLFKEVLGQEHIKKQLIYSADNGRIPHAQLFVGKEGSGVLPMAVAYAQYVLCNNTNGENDSGNDACNLKFNHLSHPDLHFSFPVNTTEDVKERPVSSSFLKEWRNFLSQQPYGNLYDWYQEIGIEKKQGIINVIEAVEINKKLLLKSYEGGYKIMIIWMAEKMNVEASNKLLKLIEEPPAKTIFILITEDEEQILQTIRSRCQLVHFPPLAEKVITEALIKKGLSESESLKIAHQSDGNFNKAMDLMNRDSEELIFEAWFIKWVRSAFKAKGNKAAIHDLLNWGEEVAANGREMQKQFLGYCLDVFRQALLMNYKADSLVFMELQTDGFKLEKFAPFVHENNILDISKEIQNAIFHIERNGNAKIIFTDLSIKLTRLLHKKSA